MPADRPAPPPTALALAELPAAVAVLDAADRLTGWSPAAADLFALPPSPAFDRPAAALVPPHAVPHWNRATAAARDRGKWAGDLRLQTLGGDERIVEVRMAARGGGDVVVAFADVTERERHAAAARRAWERRTAEKLAHAAAAEFGVLHGPGARKKAEAFDALARRGGPDDDAAEPPAGGGAVLLVGGDPLARECLRLLIESRGVPVAAAADAYEAADLYAADRLGVRAAVIDADLPGWGAAAAVTALRRLAPLLPVVLVGDPSAARVGGDVQAVVPKPARAADVLWAVTDVAG